MNIGLMHEHGYGVPQDYVVAARWYELAAAQDLAPAEWQLGASRGHAPSETAVGLAYARGKAVRKDQLEAV